jgi:hypothetical protein
VSLFGTSELEHLKYNNTLYAFYDELYTFVLNNKFARLILPFNFIEKKFRKLSIKSYNTWNTINYDISLQWLLSFGFFIIAVLYTLTFLPYGRFYNKLGGNFALLIAYFYIFGFLTFMFIRNSWILNNSKLNILN